MPRKVRVKAGCSAVQGSLLYTRFIVRAWGSSQTPNLKGAPAGPAGGGLRVVVTAAGPLRGRARPRAGGGGGGRVIERGGRLLFDAAQLDLRVAGGGPGRARREWWGPKAAGSARASWGGVGPTHQRKGQGMKRNSGKPEKQTAFAARRNRTPHLCVPEAARDVAPRVEVQQQRRVQQVVGGLLVDVVGGEVVGVPLGVGDGALVASRFRGFLRFVRRRRRGLGLPSAQRPGLVDQRSHADRLSSKTPA